MSVPNQMSARQLPTRPLLATRVLVVAALVLLPFCQPANASISVGDGGFHDISGSTISGNVVVSHSSIVQVSGPPSQHWGTLVVGGGCELIFAGGATPQGAVDPPAVPEPTAILTWSLLAGLGMVIGARRYRAAR